MDQDNYFGRNTIPKEDIGDDDNSDSDTEYFDSSEDDSLDSDQRLGWW